MTVYTHEVWIGALMATPGNPSPDEEWIPCKLGDRSGQRIYVWPANNRDPLYVPEAHVRKMETEL